MDDQGRLPAPFQEPHQPRMNIRPRTSTKGKTIHPRSKNSPLVNDWHPGQPLHRGAQVHFFVDNVFYDELIAICASRDSTITEFCRQAIVERIERLAVEATRSREELGAITLRFRDGIFEEA